MKLKSHWFRAPICWLAFFLLANAYVPKAYAEPSLSGQTGLIVTPNARIEEDGTSTIGLSYYKPYAAFYNTISLWPNFEVSLIANRVGGVSGFENKQGYGSYKDKRLDWKLRLVNEGEYTPEIAIGSQDFYGTRLWGADYIAATKRYGGIDVNLGYANKNLLLKGSDNAGAKAERNRLSGIFGGIRYQPLAEYPFKLVAEYDPIKYSEDRFAEQSRVAERRGKINIAAEVRWQWLGLQAAKLGNRGWGINGNVQIPLNRREFVPKVDEPEAYTELIPRPTSEMWFSDNEHKRRLISVLLQQDFKDIKLNYRRETGLLELYATNTRISDLARAIGRAARPLLLHSPLETREIKVHFVEATLPFATYHFFDLNKLRQYFNGQITRATLVSTVKINFAEAMPASSTDQAVNNLLDQLDQQQDRPYFYAGNDESGQILAFRSQAQDLSGFSFIPLRLASLLNDPSGAFQYRVFSDINWSKRLAEHAFFDASVSATLIDSFRSDIDPSNSPLPHVRSDMANYARGSRFKLQNLTLHQYFQPANRWYGRISAGMLEEMFAGAEGQLLYVPNFANWAVDFTVDAVKQRDYKAPFKFLPYQTVTGLMGLHYRFNDGYTVRARIGRFLAGDIGTRLEFKRRFVSGIELGAWLGVTNNKDYNASGSAGRRFIDKGVFISLPTSPLLTRDTRAAAKISIAEWGRDVAQGIYSNRDLYDAFEKPLIDINTNDSLNYLSDYDDNQYSLPRLGSAAYAERNPLSRVVSNFANGIKEIDGYSPWIKATGLGLTVLGLGTRDKQINKFALRHSNLANNYLANLLPLGSLAVSGLLAGNAFQGENTAKVGYSALTAAASSLVIAQSLKFAFNRAAPNYSLDNDFQRASKFSERSFPSLSSTATWAVATTLAQAYDQPLLYGVAALTNISQTMQRKHWFSDTVAASLIGYGIGSFVWQQNRQESWQNINLSVLPQGVSLEVKY